MARKRRWPPRHMEQEQTSPSNRLLKACLKELSELRQDINELKAQSKQLGSSSTQVTEDPCDYGRLVRSLCPVPNGSILPKPITGWMADSILPAYVGKKNSNRILEANFRSWMKRINKHKCKYDISYEGRTSRTGRSTKKADFHLILQGKPNLDFYSVAVFGLLSRNAPYNGDREVGELFIRLASLTNIWRHKAVGGLTNGFVCEWFVIEKHPGRFLVEVTPEYDFRESLCGLLVANPSSLYYMDFPMDEKLEITRQLGGGHTSSVYLVTYEGEQCAGKFYNFSYKNNRRHELEMLKRMEGVAGVPTVVDILLMNEDALFMKPVGAPLIAGMPIDDVHKAVFSNIVDILRAAHERGIVHRDIRLPNIVLVGGPDDKKNEACIILIDWGFAAEAGVKGNFAGSVETGSDQVLKQLENISLKGDARAQATDSMQTSLLSASRFSAETSLEDTSSLVKRSRTSELSAGSSEFVGRITRGKAKLMESSSKERSSNIADDSSVAVPLSCSFFFHPRDDLVSLVRAAMMYGLRDVANGIRHIGKVDYAGHIKFWAEQMQDRPAWASAQNYAENCEYDKLKAWLDMYAKNYL